jgi:SAM-dependent methyltransferase
VPLAAMTVRIIGPLLAAAAAHVLDLGCGTGRIATPLAALGRQVAGVDQSPAMLASLRGTRDGAIDVSGDDDGVDEAKGRSAESWIQTHSPGMACAAAVFVDFSVVVVVVAVVVAVASEGTRQPPWPPPAGQPRGPRSQERRAAAHENGGGGNTAVSAP